MNKQTLANMFGIETHEEDVRRMNIENESLASQVARLQIRNDQLHEELAFYKLADEDKVKLIREDADQAYEIYVKLATKCDKMIEEMEQIAHREFARGRQAAYSEMGIWRLDALDAGNRLVMDACGNVYELLNDLEDVKPDDNDSVNTVSTSEFEKAVEDYLGSEIEIDDLV